MRGETDDSVGANDVVGPGATPLLHFEKVVLLAVVKVGALVVVTRNVLRHWNLNRSEVNAVVLQDRSVQFSQGASSSEHHTYLAASLEANPLQIRADGVDDINKVPEKRDVLLLKLPEVILVDVGGEESMGHVFADVLQLCCNLLLVVQEIGRDEFHARIDPVIRKSTAGGNDNLAPREDQSAFCRGVGI